MLSWNRYLHADVFLSCMQCTCDPGKSAAFNLICINAPPTFNTENTGIIPFTSFTCASLSSSPLSTISPSSSRKSKISLFALRIPSRSFKNSRWHCPNVCDHTDIRSCHFCQAMHLTEMTDSHLKDCDLVFISQTKYSKRKSKFIVEIT